MTTREQTETDKSEAAGATPSSSAEARKEPATAFPVVGIGASATGGAFGGTTIQYLVDCGLPKLEKPFDTCDLKRLVSARIQLAQRAVSRRMTGGE